MASPQKFYVQEISRKTNYRANWLPDKPMNIGDVGKLEDGIFTLYTTLEHEGIPMTVRESSSSLDLDYTSNDSVKISHGLESNVSAGSPLAKGRVVLKIEFQKSEGVVFQMTDSKKIIIENLGDIENEILDRYKKKIWNLNWVVVTEVVKTDSATIIINTSAINNLEFEVTGKAQIQSVNLADTGLGLRLLKESGTSTKMIAKTGLTPLYVAKGISDPLIGKTKFRGADAYRGIQFNNLREIRFNPSEIE